MTEEDFAFHHLETKEDVEQHLEVMRKVFGENGHVDLQVKKWIEHHPTMTLKDFLVIKHRGRIVACLNIIPSRWSIGGVELKVSELGCVTTLPEYRHRGLQRILQTEYHKQLSEEGYDLSAIEGIPYFYRQFGYEYALPLLEQVTMRFDEVPDYKVTNEIRPFTESDIPQASRLLKRAQEKFYVHTVRDAGIWKMQQETGMIAEYRFDGYVVEENEKIRAYFRVSYNPDEKELLLREITDVGHGTAKSILGFLKNVGTERDLETLVATISHQGSFAEHMAAIGGIKKVPPYAWQLRIMDYAGMFRKLTPLFEKRLEESIHRDLTETVNFNFYRFTIQVDVENGTIKSVQCVETSEDRSMRASPSVFTQLLFGYRSREELETIYPDFMVRPTHKDLVDVMFPKLPSYIHTEY